jgi:hypothetical protein
MTIQAPNLYVWKDQYCWTPDVGDEDIISRGTFPIGHTICCTGCYRGFIAHFGIDEEQGLTLKTLEGFDREDLADIDGAVVEILYWDEVTSQENMQGVPRGCRYTFNEPKPINWSGKMRLVKLRSRDLVVECFFENGELVHVNDLSGTKLEDYREPSMAEADIKEAERLLDKMAEKVT